MMSTNPRFLVIQTAFIGDVILATAVVAKLRRFYPGSHIAMVVRQGNEALLAGHPAVDEVIVWNKREGKYSSLWKVLRRIRAGRFDHVFNLQRFASTGFLTAFSGARERVGYHSNPFAWAFDRRIRHTMGRDKDGTIIHEVHRNLAQIEHLTDSSEQRPVLVPSAQDRARAGSFGSMPYVTMSPASVWFTKQWPAEKWIALIRAQRVERIYLLGGPGDAALCEEIRRSSGHPGVQVLAGSLSLLASAALMQGAAMNFVNDSAPLHLCSAVNAPVRAIFCSTVPEFGFGPSSDNGRIVETDEPLDCRPCGLHGHRSCPRGHFRCSQIPIERIMA